MFLSVKLEGRPVGVLVRFAVGNYLITYTGCPLEEFLQSPGVDDHRWFGANAAVGTDSQSFLSDQNYT